ncbi:hypothetical protein AB1Y20_006985 [Prymnesium parvum]|uniref:Calmodulin n=1 Tax=Prymnesium parvum TaxID=97485 RepID=A0AB34J1G9_PRYPA
MADDSFAYTLSTRSAADELEAPPQKTRFHPSALAVNIGAKKLSRTSLEFSVAQTIFGAEEELSTHFHKTQQKLGGFFSGAVCFILYFFFSIVFSTIIFQDLASGASSFGDADGVGVVLLGVAIGCLAFARGSHCKAIIAGPDLLPIVFVQESGIAIRTFLKSDPDGATKVLPTTLVSMVIGNVVVGALFFALGHTKKTSAAIGFVPASVISGFLSCIGYKVIKLAVFISTTHDLKAKYLGELVRDYDDRVDPWVPILLAVIIGVSLYMLKRRHVLRTDILILTFILVPLAIFYVGVAISGKSMQELRDTGWFLTTPYGCADGGGGGSSEPSAHGSHRRLAGGKEGPFCEFSRVDFWLSLEIVYSSEGLIAWEALPQCIGIWLMGAMITALDNMLKLSSSETALKVDLDYNHEMQVGGLATLVSALLTGMPCYGQTKFNLINYSIVHSTTDPVPTITCGLLCFLTILSGVAGPIINVLPRFLLAGLLINSGAGFIVENLIEGRLRLTRVSFSIVWIIFSVNFVWEFFVKSELSNTVSPLLPGLLVVFVLGIILAAFEFIASFMHKDPPANPIRGVDICSTALRPKPVELRLGEMASWYVVLPLHGFVFFGSATVFYQRLKALISTEMRKPRAERIRIVLLDCSGLTGIDPTARNTLTKVHRLVKEESRLELLWAGLNLKFSNEMRKGGLFQGTRHFGSLDVALKWVEDEFLRHAAALTGILLGAHPTLKTIHHRSTLASAFSIATTSPDRIPTPRLIKYSTRVAFAAGEVVFDHIDAPEEALFLLFVGELLLTEQQGYTVQRRTVFPGTLVNYQRALLFEAAVHSGGGRQGGHGGAPASATALTAAVLLKFSRDSFATLQRDEPALAMQLLLAVIRQSELQRPGRTRLLPTKDPALAIPSVPSLAAFASSANLKPHRVELTQFQLERFTEVFALIDADGSGMITVDELEAYMSSVGRTVPSGPLAEMLRDISSDLAGSLSRDDFLEFLRQNLVADLPATLVAWMEDEHAAAAAASSSGRVSRVSRRAAVRLLRAGGFTLPTRSAMEELMDNVDADASGDISKHKLLVAAGMIRHKERQASALAEAFSELAKQAGCEAVTQELSADHLSKLLNVDMAVAEEIVFLADLDRFSNNPPFQITKRTSTADFKEPTIDLIELYRLIVGWT